MAENRRAWLARPENACYCRDNPKAKERTKEWRKRHPGYWKKARRAMGGTLSEQRMAGNRDRNGRRGAALPEERLPDDPVIIGLIAEIAGSTLPEQIARVYRDVVAKGREIIRTQKTAGVVAVTPTRPAK
jgi:hypothetical protein